MSYRNTAVLAAMLAMLAVFAGVSTEASAQHEGHTMPPKTDTAQKTTKPKPKTTKAVTKKPASKPAAKTRPKATGTKAAATKATATRAKAAAVKPATAVKPAGVVKPDTAHHAMPHHSPDSMKLEPAKAHTPGMTHPTTGPSMPKQHHDSTMPPGGRVHAGHDMMSGPLSISMDRMGSGTTWIPDAVTVPSRHSMLGQWELMVHGFLFGQYDAQSGRRGDDQFGSLNWIMLMASRELAGGHFQARTMLSLDPWTVTAQGYPLLLQTGESYKGRPLHDRQHPHDFWMELAALYQREFNNRIGWSLYAGPSAEPALGPVAFMHRPSAMDNPAAPLSHHWQDATHVSFGVITGGLFTRRWQLEGSVFNGREPDEHRWNIEPIKLDSYSGRVTFNPTVNWSLSAGAGYMKSPEALHADESMHRYTASILHGRQLGEDGQSATAAIWGANKHSGSDATHSVLLENETILDTKNTLFGRAEYIQKTGEDLVLDEEPAELLEGIADPHETRFSVGALQLGYIRELARIRWATIGLGAAGTVNFVPESLEGVYGSRTPVGAFVFLRLRPFHLPRAGMQDMKNMNNMRPGDTTHRHE